MTPAFWICSECPPISRPVQVLDHCLLPANPGLRSSETCWWREAAGDLCRQVAKQADVCKWSKTSHWTEWWAFVHGNIWRSWLTVKQHMMVRLFWSVCLCMCKCIMHSLWTTIAPWCSLQPAVYVCVWVRIVCFYSCCCLELCIFYFLTFSVCNTFV